MLIRYCAGHPEHFGYPRVLGVRWRGWRISTVGGLCEACRERERSQWRHDPYGMVLIPAPVELGPRTLGRRVFGAIAAAVVAAVVTTAALLVVQPPDLIPSDGQPGSFSSGTRLAGPATAEADTPTEKPVVSRPPRDTRRAPSRAVFSRAAFSDVRLRATPVAFARGCVGAPVAVPTVRRATPRLVATQSP